MVYVHENGEEYYVTVLPGATLVGRQRQPGVRIFVHSYEPKTEGHRRAMGWSLRISRRSRRVLPTSLRERVTGEVTPPTT